MKIKLLRLIIVMSKFATYGMLLQTLFFSLLLAETTEAQKIERVYDVHLNLNLNDAKIVEVFQEIESKTDFHFSFDISDIENDVKINYKKKNATVADALLKLSKDGDLKFRQVNNYITVKKIEYGENKKIEIVIQATTVTGKVTSAEDDEGLPGANVIVKGTVQGTVTDVEGNYSLEIPGGESILVFSSVGYITEEIIVGSRSVVDIKMTQDVTALDELVVIGYGYKKKKDLTGAISSLASEDLNLGGTVSSAVEALQGKTPGVWVTKNANDPGGSVSVRIRGSNSISTTNEPLYVVDGFPSESGKDINPNDIENMQVLKDASATAIYGARGANGVILITTKRGKSGESKISYSGYTGVQKIVNPFDMLNGKQYMLLANELFKEVPGQENIDFGAYTQSQLESDISTDWIDETTRLGSVQSHNINLTAGSGKTMVMTSLGYFKQDGILENTNFSRFSGRINIDHNVSDFVKIGATMFGQRENSNFQFYGGSRVQSNVLWGILTYDPTVAPYNADGSFGRVPGGQGDNPLANLIARENLLTKDKFNGNMYLEIEPLKGLTARIDGGVELIHGFKGRYLPRETYLGGIDDGVANTEDVSAIHSLFDIYVNYKKEIGNDHSFGIMGGYSYEKFSNEYRGINVKGFSTDLFSYNNLGAASVITSVASGKQENILISFFGRANYTFKDKFLFTFTLRRDGTSRVGEDNRWGTFPSAAVAWRLSEEQFIKDLGLFSDFKLRFGYGKSGNEQVGNYASLALMNNTHLTFNGINNVSGSQLNPNSPANNSLRWETTSQYNLGFDMAFVDSRILTTIDIYSKKTSDLLIQKALPVYSGYSSVQSNVGEIENKGFEFSIESKNFVNEFKWNTTFNLAVNKNEVASLGGESEIFFSSSKPMNGSEEEYAIIREGEQLGSLYGFIYEGVLQAGEVYAPQPNSFAGDPIYRDISGPEGVPDGKITAEHDRTIIGTSYPNVIYGMTNYFEFKNFDLNIFIYGSEGNDILNYNRINLERNRTVEALNRWTPTNTDTDQPRNGFVERKYGGFTNTHFVEDASFLRLRNVTLGYTINTNKKIVKYLRIYVSGENLLTLTKYTGWDPEVSTKGYESDSQASFRGESRSANTQGGNAAAGLDFNSYPGVKAYTVGINVTF